MSGAPVVVHTSDRTSETWPEDQVAERGDVSWKTLISAPATPSDTLTLGVARLAPGTSLRPHRHEQPELYYVLEGSGVVTVDGSSQVVGPDAAVFVPGNARHCIACTGEVDLRFAYVFAADSFEDVEYVFGS
jgi:mannose-6-phosphate isomerase-like protein (cupin superfamily)